MDEPASIVKIVDSERKKVGLTLAELEAFVIEAKEAGIDPKAHVHVAGGMKGQLTKIKAPHPYDGLRKPPPGHPGSITPP